VAKLDENGKFLWAVANGRIGNDTDNAGFAIAVDGLGNSYVTGIFENTVTFGSTTLTSETTPSVFVAKLDSGGKFLWAVATSGNKGEKADSGHSIAVDGSGKSYVTGYFAGTATFGSTTLTSKGLVGLFVTKLDKNGKFLWAVAANGIIKSGLSTPGAVDGLGNSYITGSFMGTATFGSTILIPKGPEEVFVAKVDSGGKFLWAIPAGGIDLNGGASIAVDGLGNSYITGSFMGTAIIGSATLTSIGSSDIFVAKLDKNGKS
jgi:hypothetical protein